MDKSEFLKEISSLSREEIQRRLLEGSVKKKKLQPVTIVQNPTRENMPNYHPKEEKSE
jgi:hypothetical protein